MSEFHSFPYSTRLGHQTSEVVGTIWRTTECNSSSTEACDMWHGACSYSSWCLATVWHSDTSWILILVLYREGLYQVYCPCPFQRPPPSPASPPSPFQSSAHNSSRTDYAIRPLFAPPKNPLRPFLEIKLRLSLSTNPFPFCPPP